MTSAARPQWCVLNGSGRRRMRLGMRLGLDQPGGLRRSQQAACTTDMKDPRTIAVATAQGDNDTAQELAVGLRQYRQLYTARG